MSLEINGKVCAQKTYSEFNKHCEFLKPMKNAELSKYDQWERQGKKIETSAVKERMPDKSSMFKVGHGRKHVSSKQPQKFSKSKRKFLKPNYDRKKLQEIIDILELRIRHCKQTTTLYQQRCRELIEINLEMLKEIETTEHETYSAVKKLLRKYEQFRGSISTLNFHFSRELSEVKGELENTKDSIQSQLQVLEHQVNEMDRKLRGKQEELQNLKNYKDKEYPVKQLMISKLTVELEAVQNSHQADREELEHLIQTELNKFKKRRMNVANTIVQTAAKEHVAKIPQTLQEMALQNKRMEEEIEYHKKEQKILAQRNSELEKEVAALSQHSKSNLRLHMFPELFTSRNKCDPQEEIVLDIPKQEWLPL